MESYSDGRTDGRSSAADPMTNVVNVGLVTYRSPLSTEPSVALLHPARWLTLWSDQLNERDLDVARSSNIQIGYTKQTGLQVEK